MASKRMKRSSEDRILLGVCGGLAEHYDIDPTLVRLGAGLLFIATGFMPLTAIYLFLALIMPLDRRGRHHLDGQESGEPARLAGEGERYSSEEVEAWDLEKAGVSPRE